MFPSIDNEIGAQRVKCKLNKYANRFDVPVKCIVEALEICFRKNCSTYHGQFWLQENATAMGLKNSCSYADIVAENIDKKVLASHILFPELKRWFCF